VAESHLIEGLTFDRRRTFKLSAGETVPGRSFRGRFTYRYRDKQGHLTGKEEPLDVSGEVAFVDGTWGLRRLTLTSHGGPLSAHARQQFPSGAVLRAALSADIQNEPPRVNAPPRYERGVVDDDFLAALSNRLMWLARTHGDPVGALADEMGMCIPDNRMAGWLRQARNQRLLPEASNGASQTSRGGSGGVPPGAKHTITNLSFGPCRKAGGVLTRTFTGDFVFVGDGFGVSGKVSFLSDAWAISQLTMESDDVPVGSLARKFLPTGDILRGAAAADLTEEPPRFIAPEGRVTLTDESSKGWPIA
jgi:hypothetical protein